VQPAYTRYAEDPAPKTPGTPSSKLALADQRKFSEGLARALLSPEASPSAAASARVLRETPASARRTARPETARRDEERAEIALLNARLATLAWVPPLSTEERVSAPEEYARQATLPAQPPPTLDLATVAVLRSPPLLPCAAAH
jgi:hypothetical protein